MSIGLLIVNPLLQQYKSLGTYGIRIYCFTAQIPIYQRPITISHCYIVLLAQEILYKK